MAATISDNEPDRVDTASRVSDEIKATASCMHTSGRGISVHPRDGQIRSIEGNPDHPFNTDVLCAKIVSTSSMRTGYWAIADQWLPPGPRPQGHGEGTGFYGLIDRLYSR